MIKSGKKLEFSESKLVFTRTKIVCKFFKKFSLKSRKGKWKRKRRTKYVIERNEITKQFLIRLSRLLQRLVMTAKEDRIMEKVLLEKMKNYFGDDVRRIKHAEKVLLYAKRILQKERGDEKIVIPAAILHDIGIHECERKYNSNGGKFQEIESPPIAREILAEIFLSDEIIEQVCQIIANHHSPNNLSSLNFRILLDADLIVNLIEEKKINERSFERYGKYFWTEEGKKILDEIIKKYREELK